LGKPKKKKQKIKSKTYLFSVSSLCLARSSGQSEISMRKSVAKVASPQQPFQEQNERYNQRHKRKRQQQRMNGTGTRAHHFGSAARRMH
jgi:hypothetical protein